jgi:ATP/maltotriose-dependent transcriptional regulator MalT
MSSFLSGNFIEASEFAMAACNLADALEAEGAYYPFEAAYILMDTFLEFGEEAKSQDYVDKFLPQAIRTHQYSWIVAFYAKAALIKAQAGKVDSALAFIRKGRDVVDGPLYGPHITFLLDGHELIARLPLGDMERIKELLFKLASNGNHKGVQTFHYTMEIMSKPEEAERIAELMPNETDQDKFRKELLLATAYIGKRNVAINHVKKAIEIAVPNGYFRAFLNLPPQVKDLILEICGTNPTNYLENLSRAIRNQTSLTALNSAAMDKPLTKQELVVLRRLDSGIPISQIAIALSISRNTIKTHLKSIYRKLSAESRQDAVAKARELMLL